MTRLIACLLTAGWLHTAAANAPFSGVESARIDYRETVAEPAGACRSLVQASDYRHSIISARLEAGAGTPEHCALSGLIPTEVRFHVALPTAWNGRILMFGNGGLAGTPASEPRLVSRRNEALARGFATAYTDTGHDRRVEPGGTFAHRNFHKLVDYGFRAVHLTITSAKLLANTYYGEPPRKNYWTGCSTGGRQALLSAQRFPGDFDGIIAGAPAADYSGLKFSQAWRVSAVVRGGFTEAKALTLAEHVYERCDALDGLEDGLIDDPRACDFDPALHLSRCEGPGADDCFDEREIAALADYYAPVTLAGREVYPAFPVGSEVAGPGYDGTVRSGWVPWLINPAGPALLDLLGSDFFRYMVFVQDRPEFDWKDFDYAQEPDGLAEFRAIVDAVDPDLSEFKARGGRIISYFGWADPDINPLTLLRYRDDVAALDPDVDDYFRVFMVPGMFHCAGGPGPDRFDAVSALIDWVEGGAAPKRIEAWHEREGQHIYSRPLCPFPQRAHLEGDDPTSAADFRCR